MNRGLANVWIALLDTAFPHPKRLSDAELTSLKNEADAEKTKIERLVAPKSGPAPLLEAARLVLEDEDGRKAGAETRAMAFLGAVAALIPLLTWAMGAANPACSPGLGCTAWVLVFILAVIYLVLAGWWSLRSLSVENYHCVAVEEIRMFAARANFELEVAKESLIAARLNRDTINRKLAFIKVAQRCFVQALFLLALLLMIDPVKRYHHLLWAEAANESKLETLSGPPTPTLSNSKPLAPSATSGSPSTVRSESAPPAPSETTNDVPSHRHLSGPQQPDASGPLVCREAPGCALSD